MFLDSLINLDRVNFTETGINALYGDSSGLAWHIAEGELSTRAGLVAAAAESQRRLREFEPGERIEVD